MATTLADSAELKAFYEDLPQFNLKPLWLVIHDAMSAEPKVKSVPYVWRWSDVRPRMTRAGSIVSAEEAERRVLMLLNPALSKPAATNTLFAGIQMVMPGEVARAHRHTPSAQRFVIEGEGAFTSVNGEKSYMTKGDYLTTPPWAFHDHGNEGKEPMLWLDGLDMPFVLDMDAMFFEYHEQRAQPLDKPVEDSTYRYGTNLKPTWAMPIGEGTYSPVLNYRWKDTREVLHQVREDKGSEFDGIIMEYVNPYTGGPTLPTMSSFLQLIRKGEHTKAHRHVSSTVYHVAEGGGYSIIRGERFEWTEGDTFVVPAWSWHEHASEGGEAVLYSFSDKPIMKAFGLEREQAHPAGRQE